MHTPVLNPKYVKDEKGERVAVIVTLAEIDEVSEMLEDLADADILEQRRNELGIHHADAMRLVSDNVAIPN